jgi:hypothetical protein
MLDCEVIPFLASIGVPTAAQCLRGLGPIAGVFFLWWLVRNIDHVIRKLFPNLEWQMQLGWLNIRAERRATALFRWISYAIYAALVLALGGIVWGATLLTQLSDDAIANVPTIFSILPILLISFAIWIAYFAWSLFPKLRRDYEHEELERFRAETHPPLEEDPASRTSSHSSLISRARSSARSRR